MGKLTRRERKKRNKKRLFNFIFFMVLISLTITFLLKSSLFDIDGFKVTGNKKLTRQEIIKASMINEGDNIFRIDKKNSIKNIGEISYTKDVSLNRKLPNKIEINIVERKPVLFIQKASVFLVIDEDGIILEEKDENEEEKPIFMGLNTENMEIGDNMFSSEQSNGIIDFIQETLNLKLSDVFERVDFKIKDNINIQLQNGILVAFGGLDNVKYKLRLLDEVLKDSQNKNIKFTKIIMNKGANPILVTED